MCPSAHPCEGLWSWGRVAQAGQAYWAWAGRSPIFLPTFRHLGKQGTQNKLMTKNLHTPHLALGFRVAQRTYPSRTNHRNRGSATCQSTAALMSFAVAKHSASGSPQSRLPHGLPYPVRAVQKAQHVVGIIRAMDGCLLIPESIISANSHM